MDTSSTNLPKLVRIVRLLKICTVKCISNSVKVSLHFFV